MTYNLKLLDEYNNKKIKKETKGERTHLLDSNNNRTIGRTGRLKKNPTIGFK